MTEKKPVELLSPAGSFDALQAALQAGADAVYFGMEELNMRARAAKQFGIDDLSEIVHRCRENNVRSYLALNTILYDGDLKRMRTLCDAAQSAGVSAVIASDIAVMQYARSIDLPVHISTQANISNVEAAAFYAQFADVMVLARELTLHQIQHIHDEIGRRNLTGPDGKPLRLELFIHGALCVSISGRCYMSLANYNHSANRGDCFQPCRRRYRVIDEETGQELAIDNQYVMSPQDICTIEVLDQLIDSGASVLKIEGRGRSADYVYHTTKCYREAVDSIQTGNFTPEKINSWMDRLTSVFNRGFWKGGYYLGNPLDGWSNTHGSKAKVKKTLAGQVTNYFKKVRVAEIKLSHIAVSTGDKLMITGPTTGYVEWEIKSLYLDEKPADQAPKGKIISIQIDDRVRAGDKVFLLEDH